MVVTPRGSGLGPSNINPWLINLCCWIKWWIIATKMGHPQILSERAARGLTFILFQPMLVTTSITSVSTSITNSLLAWTGISQKRTHSNMFWKITSKPSSLPHLNFFIYRVYPLTKYLTNIATARKLSIQQISSPTPPTHFFDCTAS